MTGTFGRHTVLATGFITHIFYIHCGPKNWNFSSLSKRAKN